MASLQSMMEYLKGGNRDEKINKVNTEGWCKGVEEGKSALDC